MRKDTGVPPSWSGHSPKGGAAISGASPAEPSVPNAACNYLEQDCDELDRRAQIERVAKALFKAIYPTGTTWEDWERYVAAKPCDGFDGRDRSRELARIAIAAIEGVQ